MKKSTCLAGALALGLIVPAAGFGASLIAASGASAQQNAGSGQTGGSVAFVLESGNAGRFEVQSGRLALERSQHVGVRGYAGQAVKEAGEMIDRVKFINNANVGAAMPEGLNTDQRACVVLHLYLGMSLEETADIVGVPRGTVQSRIHRAMRVMRSALEADDVVSARGEVAR